MLKDGRRTPVPFLFSIVALVCFCLFAALPAGAADSGRVVRIGCFYDNDFMNKSASGTYEGYDVDYLYEIAKYANWRYKFIEFDGFEDAFKALEAGSVDVAPALFRTPERAGRLLFSSDDMGKIYITLIVPSRDNKHSYGDCAGFVGMRIGLLRGTEDACIVRRWCRAQKIRDVSFVEMSSVSSLLKALDDGKLDAAGLSYMGSSSSYRVVAEFSPTPMYFCTLKDRAELMSELNAAMEMLDINTPAFKAMLNKKYFSVNSNLRPIFSREERKFIDSCGAVKVAIQLDNAPFSFLDGRGRLTGAIPDLYRHISELSGLKFEFVTESSMRNAMEAVENGKADVLGKVTDNNELAAAFKLRLTNEYMSMTMTRVSLKKTRKIWKIGLPDSLASIYETRSDLYGGPAADVVHYPNNTVAFNALQRGEVDAAYLNTACANYLVNNSRTTDYTITALTGFDYTIAAAVGPAVSDVLYKILNKCLRYNNSMTMNDLVLKYSVADTSAPFAFVNRIPASVITYFAVFMAVLILILTFLVISLARHMRLERALVAEREKSREEEGRLLVERRTNEERMEFFGNISHDMRTPLNGILGFADLALSSDEPSAMRNCLNKIKISGELLLSLVNDTLTISKIENQKFAFNPEILLSSDIIECVVTPVRSAAAAKGVRFVLDTDRARVGFFRADKLHLQKIFLNLLTNAVKFTPAGGEVRLIIEQLEPPYGGFNCKITVRDTGIGISKEFMPKMFDPFAQERRTGTSCQAGTGLGLAIVKRLVELMGGDIQAASDVGKGTEFVVRLPIERVENYTPAKAAEADLSELTGRTLLLCEDNEMNREIASSILSLKGIKTVAAINGKEGTETFAASRSGAFAAILMDLRMPVMDGFEAARAIRALDRPDAKTIPILALTADADEETVKLCAAAGMNGHAAKPIDRAELFKALQRLLEKQAR